VPSSLAEAIVDPSELKATEVMLLVCPLNIIGISFPVLASHNLILKSVPPETTLLPSGEY
jgi:hypothetical protein